MSNGRRTVCPRCDGMKYVVQKKNEKGFVEAVPAYPHTSMACYLYLCGLCKGEGYITVPEKKEGQ